MEISSTGECDDLVRILVQVLWMLFILVAVIIAGEIDPTQAAGENFLIEEGKAIGPINIGELEADVSEKLGRSSFNDAAMGRLEMSWSLSNTSGKPVWLNVFCLRNQMGFNPSVKEIRVTSSLFHTRSGISTRSSQTRIDSIYPHLVQYSYPGPNNSDIRVYGEKDAGIAFEISDRGVCSAILVYKPGDEFYFMNSVRSDLEKVKPNRDFQGEGSAWLRRAGRGCSGRSLSVVVLL